MARNSQVILAKGIRLDRNHKNILSYSESDMLSLVSGNTHKVAAAANCSFIRNQNAIEVQIPYGTALQANYLAFQNPDYANKWFFAFIDEVEYRNNSNTIIRYTIDDHATWFDCWTLHKCFVIREHTNNDTAGNNTQPENFELGEYVTNAETDDLQMKDYGYIMTASEAAPSDQVSLAYPVGGVFNPGAAYYYENYSTLLGKLTEYDQAGKGDAITNVYLVPRLYVRDLNGDHATPGQWIGMNDPYVYSPNIAKLATLQGYTPVNQKLKTFPYMALIVDNNNGSANTYRFEDFSTDTCQFQVEGVPTIGCSIKIMPKNYKGRTLNIAEGLVAGKYPVCGWLNDTYTNWLTQNSVNIGLGFVSTGVNLIAGGTKQGVAGVASAALDIAGSMAQVYQHSIVPDTARGNTNSGDINTSAGRNTFTYTSVSIKSEYAARIDQYFTRYGYSTNQLKTPNITGRANWNYVQIAAGETIGYSKNTGFSVPAEAMDRINSDYQSGVTVWHNHENIGNFDLTNAIV